MLRQLFDSLGVRDMSEGEARGAFLAADDAEAARTPGYYKA